MESFNGKQCDEPLNGEVFDTLTEARMQSRNGSANRN